MRMSLALILLFLVHFAHAEDAQKTLRWGVDLESGAPFSFHDPKNPEQVIGFETEIVQALADELGMKLAIVQNNWEGLIEGLKRHDYDIVVNGLEITPDRQQVVHFSQPYYTCAESLIIQKGNTQIQKLEDAEGKRVGTLTGSLAQRMLAQLKFPLDVVAYSEEVHIFEDLALGRVDAVLLDEPIALYYAKPNPKLEVLPISIGEMDYGIASRKEDTELNAKIQKVLQKKIEDGTVRRILEKWGLWNALTAKKWGVSEKPETVAVAYDDYVHMAWSERTWIDRLKNYSSFLPMLGMGALKTLEISLVAMVIAVLVGLLVALMRLYGIVPIQWLGTAYVEIFRGTPLLIQLYLIFYGLPHLGLQIPPFFAAVIGLGLNYGASEAENYRAGILSIHRSQMDAAFALGLSRWQSLRYVILPQAMRVVLPPVTNDFIALLKDSSLVSIITMVELTTIYGQLASTYFDYLGLGLLTAAIYFLIGLPFVRLSRWLEARKPYA
jgi:polar amino acid transport system substrate-binding protein